MTGHDAEIVGHVGPKYAVIRRIALTQIKQEKTLKLGVQGKRRTAGWDLDYLETVLGMVRI